jgi:plasmid stabilization system protein ParE
MESRSGFSIVISSKAQKGIAVSWEWYEDRFQGLGDRFLKEVTDKIKIIENSPDRYPTRFKNYKEAVLKTFPFLIIYRVNSKKKLVRIVSVFHTSRDPRKKYS